MIMAKDFNAEMNFFEEDFLAKDWLNRCCGDVSYDIFSNQEDVCYMAGELGKGRNPKLKDDVFDTVYGMVEKRMGYLMESVTMFFIKDMLDNDIDCSPEVAELVNEWYCEDLYEGRDD